MFEEGLGCNVSLEKTEGDEEYETEDNHGDDVWGVPAMRSFTSNGEGEQENDQACSKQECSSGYKQG
jgi:hypothetical protein